MSQFAMKRTVTLVLSLMALFGASGCIPGYAATTAFGLGYVLRGFDLGQSVTTCFVNGTQVDCATLPENVP